jgi:hypothetical protein
MHKDRMRAKLLLAHLTPLCYDAPHYSGSESITNAGYMVHQEGEEDQPPLTWAFCFSVIQHLDERKPPTRGGFLFLGSVSTMPDFMLVLGNSDKKKCKQNPTFRSG